MKMYAFLPYIGTVYMETSQHGERDSSVAEMNYLVRLYGSFHPVYQDEI